MAPIYVRVAIRPSDLEMAERTLVASRGHWTKALVKLWLPPSERASNRRNDALWPEAHLLTFESADPEALDMGVLAALALRDVPWVARMRLGGPATRAWQMGVAPAPTEDRCVWVSYTEDGEYLVPWLDEETPQPDARVIANVSLAIGLEREFLRQVAASQEA